jgi:hypothetical protein
MKEMSRYLVGVVTQSLRGGSPAQGPIFKHKTECTRLLAESYIYSPYKSHDDATLSCMENTLHRFHTFEDVFLFGRASKNLKDEGNALRTEPVKKRMVDEQTNAENWTPSKKRCEMNTWCDYISHEIDVSKELDANLKILKIHLISDWVEQICRYEALQQYSVE